MQLWSTRFTLPFLRTFLEWQLLRSYGQVSRSLRYYPRLADPMLYRPSFIGFHYEDPLKEALTRRELSPFAVDDEGKTLLHYAALYRNPELCSMLIRLGVNPEQRSINGYLPFGMLERVLFIRGSDIARDHVNLSTRSSDTARVLVNSQSDVEPADVQEFYKYYNGAPEGAEHVFSYDMSLSKTSDHERFQITPLHVALLHLGVSDDPSTFWQISHFEPEEWLYLVRKLLRGSVDLHAQCEELFAREWHHRTSQLLTPLQCLLLGSDNPFDGEYAAKTWLALLREAEYDQVAYLTQEMLIHAEDGLDLTEEMLIHTQDGLTDLDTWFQIPAGTRCFIGPRYQPATIMFVHLDPPRVWWDWFIEPGCKAYHVLHEFRNFNIHHETPRFRLIKQNMRYKQVDDWSQSWPFCYPNWAEESRPYPSSYNQELIAWKQRSKKARIRHARRAERTARKLTRSQ